jgi:hypothetical protein
MQSRSAEIRSGQACCPEYPASWQPALAPPVGIHAWREAAIGKLCSLQQYPTLPMMERKGYTSCTHKRHHQQVVGSTHWVLTADSTHLACGTGQHPLRRPGAHAHGGEHHLQGARLYRRLRQALLSWQHQGTPYIWDVTSCMAVKLAELPSTVVSQHTRLPDYAWSFTRLSRKQHGSTVVRQKGDAAALTILSLHCSAGGSCCS